MKQVFFDGKGKLLIGEVPAPTTPANGALVRVHASLISSGTETSQASGGGSLIRKALEQPELIGRAVEVALREGLGGLFGAVRDVAETWFPAGYSAAGVVIEAGPESGGLRAGERVACAGQNIANHAEYIAVPRNLIARLPDGVSMQEGAFATLGAIALQGVRRAEPSLGETVVVVGLGLIGQLVAQILDAAGCRVIGTDPIPARRSLAARLAGAHTLDANAHDLVEQVRALTGGVGADRTILCAATHSSQPVNQAFAMCRERGRVVMVGVMGMALERGEFYRRELDFVISRSAGPGRYDPNYEQRALDYPIGYVRWTEQRNLDAFVQLVADGKVDVASLISEMYPIEQAEEAYRAVMGGSLAVLLTYGEEEIAAPPPRTLHLRSAEPARGRIGLALVGPGSFVRAVHLPNLAASPHFEVLAVVGREGASARQIADKIGAAYATTDLAEALADPHIGAVMIATRHNLHAEQTIAAIGAGKHVFVEKPMGMTGDECCAIIEAAASRGALVTVGFNRRMAPTTQALHAALEDVRRPWTMIFRVNAGPLPPSHWLLDPLEGGGRLLGEGVHFIDFLCGLIGGEPAHVSAEASHDGQDFALTMRFADGSLGTVIYTTQGDPAFPKERVEVFAGGGVAVLDDFRRLWLHGLPGRSIRGHRQDKGHRALLENFGAALRGQADLAIIAHDGLRATRVAEAALESIRNGHAVDLA
jgi:predicted dehydrogenase/threonine dehydrogenase-like Zn-dependent dehydrogenase